MPRPAFTLEQATALAAEHFGLASPEATALPSYDDQNFRVAAGGAGYVLKVAAAGAECRGFCDAAATRGMLEMENTAMRRIAEVGVAVPTPVNGVAGGEIVQLEQLGGACEEAGTCFVRLITFLPGTLLAEVPEHPPCLLRRFGTCLGRMDQALADFSHEHAVRDLTWDLANASRARQHFADIADPADRELAARALGRFDSLVVPALGRLPRQVVHGDANDYNVLVDSAALAPPAAGAEPDVAGIGVFDFGDMVETARVCNLCVALAYVCMKKERPLEVAAEVTAAYHATNPLTGEEVEMIWPMIAARNVQSVANSAHSHKLEPDNEYLLVSAAPAWGLLRQTDEIDLATANAALRAACGLPTATEDDGRL